MIGSPQPENDAVEIERHKTSGPSAALYWVINDQKKGENRNDKVTNPIERKLRAEENVAAGLWSSDRFGRWNSAAGEWFCSATGDENR